MWPSFRVLIPTTLHLLQLCKESRPPQQNSGPPLGYPALLALLGPPRNLRTFPWSSLNTIALTPRTPHLDASPSSSMLTLPVHSSQGSGVPVDVSRGHCHGSFSLSVPDTEFLLRNLQYPWSPYYPTTPPKFGKTLFLSSRKELFSLHSVVKEIASKCHFWVSSCHLQVNFKHSDGSPPPKPGSCQLKLSISRLTQLWSAEAYFL